MPFFTMLQNCTTNDSRKMVKALCLSGIESIFNPSICIDTNGMMVAFRGLPQGTEKPFHAFVARIDSSTLTITKLRNLTRELMPRIGYPIADPKLFSFGGECWVTFNTGHFERPNSIYVMKVGSEGGVPLRVVLPGRGEIEKNWGFFEKDGLLHALYGLDPLVVLRERTRDEDRIDFDAITETAEALSRTPQLTIGTQPVCLPGYPDRLALIAHRRSYFRRKRVYTGRSVVVDLRESRAIIGKYPMLHSLAALLGSKVRHNPNLLSCTYFSGMVIKENNAYVTYGINDVGFSVANLPLSHWQSLADQSEKR